MKKLLFGSFLLFSLGAKATIWDDGGTHTLSSSSYTTDINIENGTHIIVPNGVTIQMATGKRIIVHRDGCKLTVDGGTITCSATGSATWGGVELWGYRTQPHPTNADVMNGTYPGSTKTNKQGIVIIKNGGSIARAHTGVFVGARYNYGTSTETILAYYSGGIVIGDDANFTNCYRGVEFTKYMTSGNASRFTNTDFSIYAQTLDFHVKLVEVRAVYFYGCSFLGSNYTRPFIGTGIKSINSSFVVYDELSPTTPTVFQSLYTAISATGTYVKSQTVDIHGVQIDDCYQGISIIGLDHFIITNNIINLLHDYPATSYGIYLEGCTGYKVEDNYVYASANQTADSRGVYVTNSGRFGDRIYRNTFEDLPGGIQAQNNNRGLQIKCNTFTNTATVDDFGYFDIVCLAKILVPYVLRGLPSQGRYEAWDTYHTEPAGNELSHRCQPNNYTGVTDADFRLGSSCPPLTYYYHTNGEPDCYSSGVSISPTGYSKETSSCVDRIDIEISTLQDEIDDYQGPLGELMEKPEDNADEIAYIQGEIRSRVREIVTHYLDGDNAGDAITYLSGLNDNFARTMLIPLLMDAGQYQDAGYELSLLTPDDNDDLEVQDCIDYYTIILPYVESDQDFTDITTADKDDLVDLADHQTPYGAKAKSLLEEYMGQDYPEIYLDIKDVTGTLTPVQLAVLESKKSSVLKQVFPNPSVNTVNIILNPENVVNGEVSVLDVTGKQMGSFHAPSDGKLLIDVSGYPSGLYIIQCQSPKGIANAKFIVRH